MRHLHILDDISTIRKWRCKGCTHEPKDWEKLLHMMDSTTISLFDNILKGVGRHPKSGKKKDRMKIAEESTSFFFAVFRIKAVTFILSFLFWEQ